MSTVLITGTSRGLGLSLVNLFSLSPSTTLVLATSRSPNPSAPLAELIATSNGKIEYIPLDIDSLDSVKSAFTTITNDPALPNSIDILINNAGIQVWEPEFIDGDVLTKILHTNVIGVHNVTATFLPLLRTSSAPVKKVINMTSTLGSVALVESFAIAPTPSYKISKAALNMLNAQYALQHGKEGFAFVAVSPGWLRTDLGTEIADLSVEEGAKAVFEIVESVTERDNGSFKNVSVEGWEIYDGKNVPW